MLQSQDRADALRTIDAIDAAVCLFDVDGEDYRVFAVNRAEAAELGSPREALAGRSVREILPRGAAERLEQRLARCAASGRAVGFEDQRGEGEGGGWSLRTLVPVGVDGSGAVTRILSVSVDVAGAKRGRGERRASHGLAGALVEPSPSRRVDTAGRVGRVDPADRGEHETPELGEDLRHSQKMEALGRVAGGVAHDFNNLLTIIRGYGEIALGNLEENGPPHRAVSQVLEAAGRAAEITERLLTFSKKHAGACELVDPNARIEGLLGAVQQLVSEDVRVEFVPERCSGGVWIHPRQLDQVLLNLASNASDAMPCGGTVTIRTSEQRLRQRTPDFEPGPYLHLSVADTGVGIDAGTRARMFEPFFTTKPAGQGAGLGLSTVYGIVRRHDGSIRVESGVGSGTTIHVVLPLRASSPKRRHPDAGSAPGAFTVLVVEDQPELREVLSRGLELRGHTVLSAADGRSAFELARRHRAELDVVLSDLVIPEMTGEELTEHLVQTCPGLRVVLTSGAFDHPPRAAEVASTGVSFLPKPFSIDQLDGHIRSVLSVACPPPPLRFTPT